MLGARTLRRYIAQRFLIAVIGTFGLCAVLIFMIDIVELLRQAGKFGRVPSLKIATMALLRLPAYTEFLMPFAVLAGTIGALLILNRKSELTVMRAGGMSAWQFLRPGLTVAFLVGVVSVAAYNPLAAWARVESERMFADAFGREMVGMLKSDGSGAWLRQDGTDGPSVMNAGAVAEQGRRLARVTVYRFDASGAFVEWLEAETALLRDKHWELQGVLVTRLKKAPEKHGAYRLNTHLTPERVADAIGSALISSVWQLPTLIEVAEKAGLPTYRFQVQLEQLLVRPLLLVAMVLLGATVSLRSFRSGGIQTMVVMGMLGGFSFFLLSEISRQIGAAGLAPPRIAVWVPVGVVLCVSALVLLRQEDG